MYGLRKLRNIKGLAQGDLSKLTRITVANISLYERGLSSPGIDVRRRIEAVLGETINWLYVPSVKSHPLGFTTEWKDCERTLRHLMRMIASLPEDEQEPFIRSAIKHIRNLKKHKK